MPEPWLLAPRRRQFHDCRKSARPQGKLPSSPKISKKYSASNKELPESHTLDHSHVMLHLRPAPRARMLSKCLSSLLPHVSRTLHPRPVLPKSLIRRRGSFGRDLCIWPRCRMIASEIAQVYQQLLETTPDNRWPRVSGRRCQLARATVSGTRW